VRLDVSWISRISTSNTSFASWRGEAGRDFHAQKLDRFTPATRHRSVTR
jgi:hypothetical protein